MELWYVWVFVIFFIGANLANWVHRWRNPKCKGRLPPGSMVLPLIGETLSFFVTSKSIGIHPFINERKKRYGPLFKTSIAGRPVVVSLDPDFNYYVLQQEEKLVELYYMDSFAKLVHQDNMNKLGGYLHKFVRRVILSHFGHEALKQKLLSHFEDAINHELHEWTKQPEVDVRHQTAPMLFDSASKILMSCELEENLGEDLSNILQGLMTFPLYIPGTAFYRCIKEEHEGILKQREDDNSGLLWTEYKSMTFTHYVINESLTLGNNLPGILRRTITDIHVGGYTIPKGWILLVAPTPLHFNPDIYKNPLSFNPSRWKNIGGTTMAKNFIPFGGGNRTCAGAEFSKVLVAVFLHVGVTKYRLTKIKGGDVVRAPLLEFTNGFYVKVSEKHC